MSIVARPLETWWDKAKNDHKNDDHVNIDLLFMHTIWPIRCSCLSLWICIFSSSHYVHLIPSHLRDWRNAYFQIGALVSWRGIYEALWVISAPIGGDQQMHTSMTTHSIVNKNDIILTEWMKNCMKSLRAQQRRKPLAVWD